MTHIYFVRHAQPNFENHDDFSRELSPKGLADRTLVTDYLQDKGVTAVLSSPYRRAVDTVAPLAEELGLIVVTREDFRERKVDSAWIEDFDGFTRRQWADFDYKLSDGESSGRCAKSWNSLRTRQWRSVPTGRRCPPSYTISGPRSPLRSLSASVPSCRGSSTLHLTAGSAPVWKNTMFLPGKWTKFETLGPPNGPRVFFTV